MNYVVALAEDNTVNRNTFLQKINAYDNLRLLFCANNGHNCLEELKGLPNNKLPQVIFMDLEMPELDGIQTIAIGKSLYPQIHFIVLDMLL